MKRDELILPEALRECESTGVLDTPEKVRQASKELMKAVESEFEALQQGKLNALAESRRRYLD